MNGPEFDQWLSGHCAAFPDLQAWLSKVQDTGATVKVWRGVLEDVDADAAKEATQKMARGDIEPPAAYERERTAAIIRKAAKKIAFDKKRADQDAAQRKEATRRGVCQPIGPLIRRAMAVGYKVRSGEMTAEERDAAMEQIKKEAGSDPNAYEPRYDCPTCLDHGWVEVWHPDVAAKARMSRKEPSRMASCVMACTCHRGNKFFDPPSNEGKAAMFRPLPRYDEAKHCAIRAGASGQTAVREFMDWLFGGEVEGGRYKAFDHWNEEAGTPF